MDFRNLLCNYLTEDTAIYDFEILKFSEEIIIHKSEIPLLYRYSPADYYNIRGLETQTLYLQEIGKMNDVFEGINTYSDILTSKTIQELHDIVFIKSFSENPNDQLMWAFYAENYAGMCVEYELNRMDLHPAYYYHLFPIIYKSKRKKIREN